MQLCTKPVVQITSPSLMRAIACSAEMTLFFALASMDEASPRGHGPIRTLQFRAPGCRLIFDLNGPVFGENTYLQLPEVRPTHMGRTCLSVRRGGRAQAKICAAQHKMRGPALSPKIGRIDQRKVWTK
jgi:hypothetical protein